MRSTLLSIRLGEAMRLEEAELRAVYYCTLLMYIGCTAEIELALQLFGDDPQAGLAAAASPRHLEQMLARKLHIHRLSMREHGCGHGYQGADT